MHIGNWLAQWRQYDPERVAIVDIAEERSYTYGALADRVDRLAGAMQARYGVAAGDRVAVISLNRVAVLELMFACARLNAILVPLNFRLTLPELCYMIEDSAPTLLFHDELYADIACQLGLHANLNCVNFAGNDQDEHAAVTAGAEVPKIPAVAPDAELPVAILYTSGTTGKPKGALITHRMITWNAVNTSVTWDLSGQDVTLTHTPFFHTGGLHVLTSPLLLRGGKTVLLRSFEAGEALRVMAEHRCTVVFAVPTMFQMMLDHPQFATTDFSAIRFFISGGAPCPIPLIRAYQQRGLVFKQGYGLTEIGPNCFTLHERDAVRKVGSVGFPNFFVRARVVDDSGADLPADLVGELWLSSPATCGGYWRNPEASKALFEGEWLKTGDLVRIDEEGYCYVIDRKKDMFISGGMNVYPVEIEQALAHHPAVANAAVIGIPDEKWGEVGRALVVLKEGETVSEEDLLDFLAGRLGRFKLPKSFVFVDDLPRTSTGKVQKTILRRRFGTP